jgi:hypothetical protein
MRKSGKFVSTATFTAAIFAAPALAADLPKEGRYDFVSCFSGTSNPMEFAKGYSASTQEFTGINRTTPPGGLFDKTSFRCIGITYSFEGKNAGTTICHGVDPDGDKYLVRVSDEGSKAERVMVAGTGKYDGIVASGIAEPLGPFPSAKPGTFQNCAHQTGTYKRK